MTGALPPIPDWVRELGLDPSPQLWAEALEFARTAPPFTDTQRERLRMIFRGAIPSRKD